MRSIDYVLRTAADWFFRRRSPALAFVRAGVALVVASLGGGWLVNIAIYGSADAVLIGLDTAAEPGVLTVLQVLAFLGGVALIAGGARWEKARERRQAERRERRKVIVIEQRGLRNSADSPLADALPDTMEGTREPLLIDIRERIREGVVTAPTAALERIVALKRDLETRIAGRDRSDIDIVYGGLLPVPFTFLTGMLLDDEGRITVFDWDRGHDAWRQLDGTDDGDRFTVPVLPNVIAGDVVLALSVSYQTNLPEIDRTFPDVPLVHLQLENRSTDCHWSADKQRALAQSFLATVQELSTRGATRIHLVIAAQNSVVFRLGRIYDKRNLPDAVVYQYERSSSPAYPWGVRLPTHGVEQAQILRTDQPDSVAGAALNDREPAR